MTPNGDSLFRQDQMRGSQMGGFIPGDSQTYTPKIGKDGKPKRKYVFSGKYRRNTDPNSQIAMPHGMMMPNGMHIPREHTIFKREVEFDLMLPFKTKRVEKNNNNGMKKQAKLDIRKRMINERVKQRQRFLSMKKIEAIKELIDKGELTPDALRWKVRRYRCDDQYMRDQKKALLRS